MPSPKKTPKQIVLDAYPNSKIIAIDGLTEVEALIAKYSGKKVDVEGQDQGTSTVVIEHPKSAALPKSLLRQVVIVDKESEKIIGLSG